MLYISFWFTMHSTLHCPLLCMQSTLYPATHLRSSVAVIQVRVTKDQLHIGDKLLWFVVSSEIQISLNSAQIHGVSNVLRIILIG